VPAPVIKHRAAQLRAAGDAAIARHLSAQQGTIHRILTEAPDMGRTEQFTEVRLTTPQPIGQIITARITGIEGQHLLA
jgi:threonylcarbamoyladenosine tRNA methylthiotransferase MtaB